VANKLEIFENNTIRIHDVTELDAGMYYCNTTNKYGQNRAETQLDVFGMFVVRTSSIVCATHRTHMAIAYTAATIASDCR
jgi:hypothetical protein